MSFSSNHETLIDERNALMVSPCYCDDDDDIPKPSSRISHFLKPSFPPKTLLLPSNPPLNSLLTTKPISSFHVLSPKVHFNGWATNPLKKWNSWVEKMSALHKQTWKKASIYDAIMCSKLEISKCYSAPTLFVLGEKWCVETSSFVLPWGEVSITLEDVMVLGGFSLTGDSISKKLCKKDMLGIEEKLLIVRAELIRTKHRKASQAQWLEKWMDNGLENEHEAFLSLWLSRYVLPADDFSTINKSVIGVAVLLARGNRIALGPAVLASIYRDLRLLKEKIESLRDLCDDQDGKNVAVLKLWAPFQLFQAWIWERFPGLRPAPSPITRGLRLERWNKVKPLKNDGTSKAVDSAFESFQWRPYTTPLNNWSISAKLYPEKGHWVSVGHEGGFDLESYARIIRTSELVGLEKGSVEQYLPHRVSMQFGLDQDVPYNLPRFSDSKMVELIDYNRPIVNAKLYMPARLFESDVTMEYLEWWKKSETGKEKVSCRVVTDNIKLIPNPVQGSLKASIASKEMLRIKKELNEAEVPPGFDPIGKRAALNVSSDPHSSKRSKGSPCHLNSGTKSNDNDSSSHSTTLVNGVEAEDDFEDNLPLSQLFQLKHSGIANGSACPVIDLDCPLSSEGDNESLQEAINTGGAIGVTTEDKTVSDDGSPMQSPMSADHREVGASSSFVSESPKMDLLDRIARLQRIVDLVIAEKNH